MPSQTTSNLRRGDYEAYHDRTKVFLPVFPNAINPLAEAKTTTTTSKLVTQGDKPVKIKTVGPGHLRGAIFSSGSDEAVINWKIPDDFYSGEPTHVWLVFSLESTTTTSGTFSYDVKYSLTKIKDYSTATGEEILTEAATAMDTDLDEAISITSLTKRRALYRGMRGTINAGKVELADFAEFKIEADAAPTGSISVGVIGLEIDYAMRLRSGNIVENYED